MQVEKIESVISKPRLSGYTTKYATTFSEDPVSIYKWNMALSESMYPLLHVIEVALRNRLHTVISDHFNDENWLLNGDFLAGDEIDSIQKQIAYLRRRKQLDTGHLIAELSFGFWTSLLDRRYEFKQLLWPTLLKPTFPYLNDRKIHAIRSRFNKIRKLRNRVWHYEPIWHWQDLRQQHDDILDAISWIEPELLHLIEANRFLEIYQARPIKSG